MKNALLLPLALAGLLTLPTVHADPSGHGACNNHKSFYKGHKRHGGLMKYFSEAHIDRTAARLDLSDKQKNDYRVIIDKERATARKLMDNRRAQKKKLHELTHSDKPDAKAIRQQVTAMAGTKADMIMLKWSLKQQLQTILTDEQKQRYQQMRERKFKKRHWM